MLRPPDALVRLHEDQHAGKPCSCVVQLEHCPCFRPRLVNLDLPRLSLSWKRPLIEDMKALGMRSAVVPNGADFTRVSPAGDQLYISLLQQNTFVNVDEAGTEAAAGTIVGISVTSAPVAVPMRVERPFVFVIRERFTGAVRFMGKITRLPGQQR